MSKDNNQIETERQQSEMLSKGASHNEIHNPNTRSEFNDTSKLPGQGGKVSGGSRQIQHTKSSSQKKSSGGRQAPAPTQKENTGNSPIILVIGGAIAVYFLSVMYLTESLIVAGLIALISAFILHKWGKKILIITIIAALIYFFFIKDK